MFAQVCENVGLSNPCLPPDRYRTLSVDESGDYVDWTVKDGIVHKCELGTLFGLRRKTLYHDKILNISQNKNRLPAQPQLLSMGPATLLGQMYSFVGGGTTGAQIDALRKYNTFRFPISSLVDDFAHQLLGWTDRSPNPRKPLPPLLGTASPTRIGQMRRKIQSRAAQAVFITGSGTPCLNGGRCLTV